MKSELTFKCKKCKKKNKLQIDVPSPNFAGETASDSGSEFWEDIYCEKCGEEHELFGVNNFYELYIDIQGVKESDISYSFPTYEDMTFDDIEWYETSQQSEFFNQFQRSMSNLRDILEIKCKSQPIQKKLYRMSLIQMITNLETYLGDAFRSLVLKNKELFIKLFEADNNLKEEKVPFHLLVKPTFRKVSTEI